MLTKLITIIGMIMVFLSICGDSIFFLFPANKIIRKIIKGQKFSKFIITFLVSIIVIITTIAFCGIYYIYHSYYIVLQQGYTYNAMIIELVSAGVAGITLACSAIKLTYLVLLFVDTKRDGNSDSILGFHRYTIVTCKLYYLGIISILFKLTFIFLILLNI